jgi:3-oxoacyl-[acyl-carrier-protein] synthase-3
VNDSKDELQEIDLLCCGTSIPDQLMPSHGIMVHGYLPETKNLEAITLAANCCSGMHAFKYAYMSVKLGLAKKAITTGSERLSRILHADHFEIEVKKMKELEDNAMLAFEKDFLRWMLSDGAGAFLLEGEKPAGTSLRIDWIDAFSFANEVETCMYMANDKLEDGSMKSFMDYTPQEIMDQSILSVKQDVKLLGKNIIDLGFKKLENSLKSRNISGDDIAYFIPHMSSYFFEDKIANMLDKCDLHIPKDRWYSNLKTTGNIGAASVYLMLDDLMKGDKLKDGDKVLLAVPESSRFSYVFSMLTVCK